MASKGPVHFLPRASGPHLLLTTGLDDPDPTPGGKQVAVSRGGGGGTLTAYSGGDVPPKGRRASLWGRGGHDHHARVAASAEEQEVVTGRHTGAAAVLAPAPRTS